MSSLLIVMVIPWYAQAQVNNKEDTMPGTEYLRPKISKNIIRP